MNTASKTVLKIGLAMALMGTAGCASQADKTSAGASKPVEQGAKTSLAEMLRKAAVMPSAALEGQGWKTLCDGKTLTGWQVTEFGGHGLVSCEAGLVVVDAGDALSGINFTNAVPKSNYEIALDAMRVDGSDFFCGLTFPVRESHCSLILGGWGGTVVGISSVDGQDASENETTKFIRFDAGRWYRVRVQVTDEKIEAWLDQEKIVDLALAQRKITLRFGDIDLSRPLGVATYQTTAALREIKLRHLGVAK